MVEKITIKLTDDDKKSLGRIGGCYHGADCPFCGLSNVCCRENGRKHVACPAKVQLREKILCDEKQKIEHPIGYQAVKEEQARYEEMLKR